MHVKTVARIAIASTIGAVNSSFWVFETISVETDVADLLTMVISNFLVTFIAELAYVASPYERRQIQNHVVMFFV